MNASHEYVEEAQDVKIFVLFDQFLLNHLLSLVKTQDPTTIFEQHHLFDLRLISDPRYLNILYQ